MFCSKCGSPNVGRGRGVATAINPVAIYALVIALVAFAVSRNLG